MKFLIDFPNPHDGSAARLRHGFGLPLHHLTAHAPDEVRGVLDAVQQAAQAGRWCLGWLRYEAAAAFDAAYAGTLHATPPGAPLAWFAVFDGPLPWPADDGVSGTGALAQWQPGLERADFDAAIARIHEAIAAGDCYQINYTAQMRGRLLGDVPSLFAALRRAQPGGYVACMDSGDEQVLSVSPELFFDWDGERILTRPMKGTAPRGATPEQDEANMQAMRASPKERAENVMIVDLLRNDVSRIAEPFSVTVPRLFHAEPLPTVWQMTSDVQARTRPGTRLADVFAALFPCGSITGAPKRQAMRLIHELEPGPRGVYCGAVGVVRPGSAPGRMHATFNVPIRTVVARGDELRCGIGSGITSGAEAPAEWQEWRHKRAFLDKV
ncbi:Para-aminobenzoate synthase component 1 [Delftia tsuruhatensis]|uniref:aminodeoxychorismate synthase component I n=1 Tax=Delftia tsuruhatensis TaxID=180282 RepID=UPI001E7CF4AF|nr:aminodeoxychorismate synthase component I [Delftia tsuruhatensis]CAB5687644.1 Para-aminobenzoate synthase component 1 [Delftia tsuruhatensis]CAC9690720.1 Para-aminobenzoate synthase component 1 [Delftia tsuruhatensis]